MFHRKLLEIARHGSALLPFLAACSSSEPGDASSHAGTGGFAESGSGGNLSAGAGAGPAAGGAAVTGGSPGSAGTTGMAGTSGSNVSGSAGTASSGVGGGTAGSGGGFSIDCTGKDVKSCYEDAFDDAGTRDEEICGFDQVSGGDAAGARYGCPPPAAQCGAPGPDDPNPLGACDGTAAECEAARAINEYRRTHIQAGECNFPLRWDSMLGSFAHDYQHSLGAKFEHSFIPYGESGAIGGGTPTSLAMFVSEWDENGEPHCNADCSMTTSHHCNSMRCDAFTLGIGIYEEGGTQYMTVVFGGPGGAPI